jgi:hypothetical protein
MDYTYNTVKFSDPSSMHLEKGWLERIFELFSLRKEKIIDIILHI